MMRKIMLFMLLALGSCAYSALDMEKETMCETRSSNGLPDMVLERLKGSSLGRAVWNAAILRLHQTTPLIVDVVFIKTYEIKPMTMEYRGYGQIYYNYIDETSLDFLQNAFHELFHIFQNGATPHRILNNEIEAYLAQYIYMESINRTAHFKAGSDELTQAIQALAACINLNTGNIISDKYEKCYREAMAALKEIQEYQDTNETHWLELQSSDIPNLCFLLQNLIR